MDENENVFPLFEQKFLGICKAKIRGWIFVGMYNKTKTFLDKQLEKCPRFPQKLQSTKFKNLSSDEKHHKGLSSWYFHNGLLCR